MTDSEREQRIQDLGYELVVEPNEQLRLDLWREMRDLIRGRSPSQVALMERQKGLCK